MNVKEAKEIIKNEYPDMLVNECFDLPDFYVFGMVEKGKENEDAGGGYFTIAKDSGKLGGISSMKLAFSTAKPIDIDTLN